MMGALTLAAFATAIPLSFSLAQNASVRNSRIMTQFRGKAAK